MRLLMAMASDDRSSFDVLRGRGRRPSKPFVRTRPKMPSRPWRLWAVVCVAAGAAISFAVSQGAETATLVVRTILGGLFGLAIGMFIVEGIWERRFHGRDAPPSSPIGKRR